jgi:2-polyprenyl-3-methyl-5-hydroxy-6-metoxy-1,4-benzoquinol methylase
MKLETIRCDFCGAVEVDIVYNDIELDHDIPAGCALVRCRQCGLIYLNPRPKATDMGTFYPEDYLNYRSAVEDERFWLMRFFRRHKLVRRRQLVEKFSGLKSGRILDVGCSTGLFLHEMVLSGWEGSGVEPTLSAATYARQRFGLDVFQGMLLQAAYSSHSFDVITFWDVLEHTFSPAAELHRASELLKSGGWIAINVPNFDSPEREWFGPLWNGYDPPRHLYVFTRQTLTALLQQAGFEPVGWICFMPSYFSFIISLVKWSKKNAPRWASLLEIILNIPGVRFLFEPFFSILNMHQRGSVIAVFARKLERELS